MADLKSLDSKKAAAEGAELILRHPGTGEPLAVDPTKENPSPKPWTVMLLGVDSPTYRNLEHLQQSRRIQRATRMGRVGAATSQEVENDVTELLVKVTTGWRDSIPLDGKPFEFSEENAKLLYTKYPWAREQVSGFVNDRSNYLGNS